MGDNRLSLALLLNLENDIWKYEQSLENEPDHVFSHKYRRKKKHILKWAETVNTQSIRSGEYRLYRLRRAIILVAILVISLAVASSALAIVKPEIFYMLKEKVTNWNITFEQNATQKLAFEYAKPSVPDDYEITDEVKGSNYYYITFEDKIGNEIGYAQYTPDNLTLSLDSEQATPKKKHIGNTEIITWESGDAAQIVYNDGKYIYVVDGNCGKQILYEIIENML